jgi:HNH endonuclease
LRVEIDTHQGTIVFSSMGMNMTAITTPSIRTSAEEQFVMCTACGCSHARGPRRPIVQADTLVMIGEHPHKYVTKFFRLLQGQAQQPITFGQLCSAMRDLPKKLVTPRTEEDAAMVICERAQYALKNGILEELGRNSISRETAKLISQEEHEAESAGAFDPLSLKDDRERSIASIVRRRGQPEFRQKLLRAYCNRCAVTGCNAVEALEAAHIIPYQGVDTNHLSNGLILRGDLHTLFDLGLLAVDADSLTVVLSPALSQTTYGELHGKPISVPESAAARPSSEALKQHRAGCGL